MAYFSGTSVTTPSSPVVQQVVQKYNPIEIPLKTPRSKRYFAFEIKPEGSFLKVLYKVSYSSLMSNGTYDNGFYYDRVEIICANRTMQYIGRDKSSPDNVPEKTDNPLWFDIPSDGEYTDIANFACGQTK
jgi:hypothetical protein